MTSAGDGSQTAAGCPGTALSEQPPTLWPPGGRPCTCNSVPRKVLVSPSPGASQAGGALRRLEEENRHLGMSSGSRSTIRQLLKKYYFQKQNRRKIPRRGKRRHFLGIRWVLIFFFFCHFFSGRFCLFFFSFFFSFFFFFCCCCGCFLFLFSVFPRMERSEKKNKMNHLSIVSSGVSSVSGLGRG